ncbi:MAG: ATP-dependent DNA ligase, partial [Candidatus Methanoperedens sp.]
MTSFETFAKVCKKLTGISSSLEMTSVVASFLKEVDDDELEIATRFIMGSVFPVWSEKELGIGTSLLYTAIAKTSSLPVRRIEEFVRETGDVGTAAEKAIANRKGHFDFFSEEQLSIRDVFSRFQKIAGLAGKGSQDAKIKNLQYLFGASKPVEIVYLARLAIEELRIGVGEGIVRNAVAEAFNVPVELVERAYMLVNDFGLVAYTSKKEGESGLLNLSVITGRPLKLMLAQVGEGLNEALAEIGSVAVEWKFDGARVQIHKDGNKVIIYSRRLENVTSSLPDIVKSVRMHVIADTAILDGEAVAFGKDNRPMAFQEILRRFRRKYDVTATALEIPLSLYLFDILYLNGESLINT